METLGASAYCKEAPAVGSAGSAGASLRTASAEAPVPELAAAGGGGDGGGDGAGLLPRPPMSSGCRYPGGELLVLPVACVELGDRRSRSAPARGLSP
jgi:hypothetical protein